MRRCFLILFYFGIIISIYILSFILLLSSTYGTFIDIETILLLYYPLFITLSYSESIDSLFFFIFQATGNESKFFYYCLEFECLSYDSPQTPCIPHWIK